MKRKILIVDDEPNIVMSLEYAFNRGGYEVFIARDGEEAIQIIQDILPDVVLLDIMMPNVDGFQTLEFIKQVPSMHATKVVFLSAKNKAVDIEKGLSKGADKYLIKPFSVKKIMVEINELFN
ncbi:response regulator [Putridiphycobacter roseus]|uniref:Response regulator n=1 Tax=Putridiphycobacter roseus TaxID=2219161 RepID=A0A2W1MZE7_9FLAO|nr:response regulator [Putridiphycobacter roseus]PZE17599.1 response regulator [Putridiphycobacter roseus]